MLFIIGFKNVIGGYNSSKCLLMLISLLFYKIQAKEMEEFLKRNHSGRFSKPHKFTNK